MAFRINDIVTKKRLIIIVILFAVLLRLYRFEEYVTFLGDQGRDAIIIKRIVTLEHFPAIGAPSSIGQVFLGPFYYYLMAPFLLLTGLNPVGPAFGVAVLSILGIIFAYMLIAKGEDAGTALFFLIFTSFSIIQIQMSRYSWNPNLLPIFSFLTLFFLYRLLATKHKIDAVLLGAFLSFSIQLHHLAFLMVPTLVFVYVLNRFSIKKIRSDLINVFLAIGSFLFFSLPLIIFDLRHGFLNTKSFLRLFTEKNIVDSGSILTRLLDTNRNLYVHVFQKEISSTAALLVTVFLVFILIRKRTIFRNIFLQIYFFNFIFYIFFFSFLNSFRHPHYYGPVYFSFFVVISFILNFFWRKSKMFGIVIFPVLLLFLVANLRQATYFQKLGGNQIKRAQKVARSIIRQNPQKPFQIVALPFTETDGHIRYFLEVEGYRPLSADTLADPKELYILCYEKKCQVLGNAQWQIAAFREAKIDTMFTVEGIVIYKVVHDQS